MYFVPGWQFTYFLFSRHSQTANAAVTIHAAILIHIGIPVLFSITFA